MGWKAFVTKVDKPEDTKKFVALVDKSSGAVYVNGAVRFDKQNIFYLGTIALLLTTETISPEQWAQECGIDGFDFPSVRLECFRHGPDGKIHDATYIEHPCELFEEYMAHIEETLKQRNSIIEVPPGLLDQLAKSTDWHGYVNGRQFCGAGWIET